MPNRNQLTFFLLAACAIGAPLSFATGESAKPVSPFGFVGGPAPTAMPAFSLTANTGAAMPQPAGQPMAQPVSLPIMPAGTGSYAAQTNAAPVFPTGAAFNTERLAPQPTAPVSFGVLPAARPISQVVLPSAPMQPSAEMEYSNVQPGENPFARSPQAARTAPAQPTSGVMNQGQPTAPAIANPAQAAKASGSEKPEVDETALRYYGATRDFKRLGAELRRLKALYPGWEAPENIFDPPTDISEQPIWDLFALGNYAGAREMISHIQSENPNWVPSEDLRTKLATAEIRKLLERSYARHNWQEVISLAEGTPELMVCGEMNAMWLTAEALAYARDFKRSFDLYKHILVSCDDPGERQATVQKASLVLPEAGIMSLLAFGRTAPDGSPEFENLSFDPLRLKMGQIAAGAFRGMMPVGNDQLQAFGEFVQRTGSAKDASLFGWFYYGQENWQASLQWFAAASYIDQDPKNIEGIILSLRNLDQGDQALALARQYAPVTPELTKIYTELVAAVLVDEDSKVKIDETEIKAFYAYVEDQESALGAQALGWYRLRDGKTKEAKSLFDQSVDWEPTEGGVVGLAVLASRSKSWGTVSSIKKKYGEEFAALEDIKVYRPKAVPTKKKYEKKEVPTLFSLLFGDKDEKKKKKKP